MRRRVSAWNAGLELCASIRTFQTSGRCSSMKPTCFMFGAGASSDGSTGSGGISIDCVSLGTQAINCSASLACRIRNAFSPQSAHWRS